MCTTLTETIDQVSINVSRDDIVAAFEARSRLDAKLCGVVRDFDELGLWELDGATSMVAWLKTFAGLSGGGRTRS